MNVFTLTLVALAFSVSSMAAAARCNMDHDCRPAEPTVPQNADVA